MARSGEVVDVINSSGQGASSFPPFGQFVVFGASDDEVVQGVGDGRRQSRWRRAARRRRQVAQVVDDGVEAPCKVTKKLD